MREYKFRVWYGDEMVPLGMAIKDEIVTYDYQDYYIQSEYDDMPLMQYTGLKDKNGKEGYFDSDIWEVKNYEYRIKWCNGYKREFCDLRFVLTQDLLKVEWELINPPKDLKHISLSTIFNLKLTSGKRLYVDDDRKKLEIIGNIYENPELLEKQDGK